FHRASAAGIVRTPVSSRPIDPSPTEPSEHNMAAAHLTGNSLYLRALEQTGGNAAAAARALGVEPHTLRAAIERLGIRPRRVRRTKLKPITD
ncbi:MAG: hypothetical protein FJ033_16480, partial [Chloroflexi bacterium]|nr:hypothetical protein [Chloroflexota bacterium]